VITKYSEKFRAVYDTMNSKFDTEFVNLLSTDKRQNAAADVNHRVSMSALIFTHFLSIGERWTHAFSDCKSGLIPESLVERGNLSANLQNLKKSLDSKYKLTVEYEGPAISRYYKAPLADCVLTPDKFYVRILVPLSLKRKTETNLVRIKSIPFMADSTENKGQQLCVVQGFENGRMYNMASEKLGMTIKSLAMEMHCDTVHFGFCKIPDPLEKPPDRYTLCARALIMHDIENSDDSSIQLQMICKMECVDVDESKVPIVVRGRDQGRTVYIAGTVNNEFWLECKNQDTKKVVPPKVGAIAVIIPCSCVLVYKDLTIQPNYANCPDELIMSQVLPTAWAVQNLVS